MQGEAILWAIELANTIRSVGDHDRVDDLIPGDPGEPNDCVLAKTFNCECEIEGAKPVKYLVNEFYPDWYIRPGVWFAWFSEKKYADALASQLSEVVIEWEAVPSNRRFGVRLPHEVGMIAKFFDDGELEDRYYIGGTAYMV